MSLLLGVKFRDLIDQLTIAELKSFFANLTASHAQLLIHLLFEHFSNPKKRSKATAQSINATISEIIRKRKPEKKKTKSEVGLKAVSLPIISKISSFLHQKSYARLCRVSRLTYCGCHSPNNLQSISLLNMFNDTFYQALNTKMYPSVKHLHAHLKQIYMRPDIFGNADFLDQMESISLSKKQISRKGEWVMKHLSTVSNVQTLHCTKMNVSTDLLAKFPNLRHLKLSKCPRIDVAEDIKTFCPNLIALSLDGWKSVQHLNDLIRPQFFFSRHLQSLILHVADDYSSYFDENSFDFFLFSELREIRIFGSSSFILSDISKSANKLKRISMKKVQYLENMDQVMINCPILQLIEVEPANNEIESFVPGMLWEVREGLKKTNNVKRAMLKIKINKFKFYETKTSLTSTCDALVCALLQLIIQIKSSRIQDFMFVLESSSDTVASIKREIQKQIPSKCDISISGGLWSWQTLTIHANR